MVTTQPDNVTLTINGQPVTARKGTLLVEAAKQIDVEIPIFCYHPKLKPVGACRMCLVQIEKLPRLQTACTTPVGADMIVHTNTPEVIAAQNGVLELLLANHPLDCPVCDKGGECPLQDNTFEFGLGVSRFTEEKRRKEKAYPLGERIVLDRERCIMCYRCVRFHQEISGDESLAAVQRGSDTEIATLTGEPYDSMFSGNTIELCPVGALTSRQYRFTARPWDLVRTPSVCNGCAVGCNVEVHSRTENVLRLVARENPAVDDGWLCDMGRFDTIPAPRRGRPLLRRDGALHEVDWPHALARAAELLGAGGGALVSAGVSNEAFWLLQALDPKLPAALWPPPGGHWPVRGAIQNLAHCKRIVLVGLDVWNQLPILALWIRRAVLSGARLVVLGSENGLWRNTTHQLPLERVADLTAALLGNAPRGTPTDVSEAAVALRGTEPAALLVHPHLVADAPSIFEELAEALGVDPETGIVGAPLLGANGRGAQDLAPSIAGRNIQELGSAASLLLLGDEAWAELDAGSARVVLATSRPVPDDGRVDVVLPMAHPYERQASITNLEGRVQQQDGGAAPPPRARADWSIVAGLASALGVAVPDDLLAIRAAWDTSRD
jgi:NADH-quinone oxidoreductase subunit G